MTVPSSQAVWAGIANGSYKRALCNIAAKRTSSSISALLLLAEPSVPKPTTIPLASISGTGAIPLANFKLDCGLWATRTDFSFIISISSSVTCTQWAAKQPKSNKPKSFICAIGVLPVAFITFSTSPFVSLKCIWTCAPKSWPNWTTRSK